MKIVCIRKYQSTPLKYELTYGKTYTSLDDKTTLSESNYLLINDRNYKEYYTKHVFISLQEWREKQINDILKNK